MKAYRRAFVTISMAVLIFVSQNTHAQTMRLDKLYSMSGFGFSFPVGNTAHYFKPKFSTTLGLNVGLGQKGLFLYPNLGLQVYSFFEKYKDAKYAYAIQKGRASTYLLNMNIGYRKFLGSFAVYGFAGGGGGFILTQRVTVEDKIGKAFLDNKTTMTFSTMVGVGAEYNAKSFTMFVESSYIHGFAHIQQHQFNALPLTIGIKPHLEGLLRKKKNRH